MSTLKFNYRKSIVLGILNIFSSIAFVSLAAVTKFLMDKALNKNYEDLVFFIWLLFIVLLIGLILKIIQNFLKVKFIIKREMELKKALFISKLNADFYLNANHTATTLQVYNMDINNIINGELEVIPMFFYQISRLVYASILIVFFDWRLILVFLCLGIIGIISMQLYAKMIKPRHKKVLESDDKLSIYVKEAWENLHLIRTYNAEDSFTMHYENKQQEAINARNKKYNLQLTSSYLFLIGSNILYAGFIAYGGFAIYYQLLTYGTFLALMQLLGHIEGPIFSFSPLINKYTLMLSSRKRYLDQYSDVKLDQELLSDFDSITFEDISFSYGSNKVIDNISFEINKKDIVQIKGDSGRGKTTLLALLLGLIKANEGQIKIKYRNEFYDYDKVASSLFAYVPQINVLFSGTIKENFELLTDADDEQIKEALIVANLDKEIIDLNQRLNENGKGLSVGQLQRLMIAIAYAKNRPIFLLDEFTSALDKENSQIVINNLLKTNKTIIYISHKNEEIIPNKVIEL